MNEEEEKQEEKVEFTPEGELLDYIGLSEARVVAMRHARENPGYYTETLGDTYADINFVWELVSQEEDEDYYDIKLSFRPAGRFRGEAGLEHFVIDKLGNVEMRQILDEPSNLAQSPQSTNPVETENPPEALTEPEMITTPSRLQYKDLTVGTGPQPQEGQTAVVHYSGWLMDGTKFDSSVDRGTPFEFPIGGGRVIKGWDEGIATMRVGGTRELIIPSNLAYGATGAGGVIPPDAILKFEVELLEMK